MTWLTAEGVGKMLSMPARAIRERVALLPNFPKPLRIDGTGHPRWREDEVARWAELERQRTGGRARKN